MYILLNLICLQIHDIFDLLNTELVPNCTFLYNYLL